MGNKSGVSDVPDTKEAGVIWKLRRTKNSVSARDSIYAVNGKHRGHG